MLVAPPAPVIAIDTRVASATVTVAVATSTPSPKVAVIVVVPEATPVRRPRSRTPLDTVATFSSPERLAYPPARSQREKLLGRLDALLALSERARDAAAERFPGDYTVVSPGIDPTLFAPTPKRQLIVVELRPNERAVARGVLRALRELPDWEAVLLRTKPLVSRPVIPRDLATRVRVRTARDGASRAALLQDRLDDGAVLLGQLDGAGRGCQVVDRLDLHVQGAFGTGRADADAAAAHAAYDQGERAVGQLSGILDLGDRADRRELAVDPGHEDQAPPEKQVPLIGSGPEEARRVWPWALGAALIGGLVGFALGWRTLDSSIRRK